MRQKYDLGQLTLHSAASLFLVYFVFSYLFIAEYMFSRFIFLCVLRVLLQLTSCFSPSFCKNQRTLACNDRGTHSSKVLLLSTPYTSLSSDSSSTHKYTPIMKESEAREMARNRRDLSLADKRAAQCSTATAEAR